MRVKKVLFGCVFTLLLIGVCELTSYMGLAFFLKTYDVRERTGILMQFAQRYPMVALGPSYDAPSIMKRARNVLHPYLGFVHDPLSRDQITGIGNEPMHSYGFSDAGGDVLVRMPSKDEVVIGIFGGSLAELFAYNQTSLKILGDAVTSIPLYKGKKTVFTIAAIPGYKQPQSLMAYNYLLSLGAHFDVIITLDGFNEVTLALAENVPNNIFSVYPRGWYQLTSMSDPATQTLSYGLAERRSFFSTIMQSRAVRWSMTSRLFWIMVDASYERRIVVNEMHPNKKTLVGPFGMSGPQSIDTSTEAVQSMNVDVWSRSLMQMSNIAKANGTESFHFLQPNQHVPGSKPIGSEEADIVFRLQFNPFAKTVPTGYPLLQKAGQDLLKKGVHFTDLTYVFQSHPEPLYVDPCCHLSDAGNLILAERIARVVQEALSR